MPVLPRPLTRGERGGLPITRPLAFTYPGDPSAWSYDLEFTIGRSLLASPVTAPGTRASVYLPRGNWIDLYSGQGYSGGTAFTRTTPLTELPLFLRSGSAIPFNLRAPDIWSKPWGLSDLVRPDRAGWLIATGTGTASSTTAGRLAFATRGATFTVDVARAPRDVQLLVLTSGAPRSIVIDGRSYRRSTPTALRHGTAAFRDRPFGGAVVKLSTTGGAAHVQLRF